MDLTRRDHLDFAAAFDAAFPGKGFTLRDIGESKTAVVFDEPAPTSAQVKSALEAFDAGGLGRAKAQRLAELSAARRHAEEWCFAFAGQPLQLKESTQSRLAAARQALELKGQGETVQWQTQAGQFIEMDLEQLTELGLAAFDHVQACFARAKALAWEIEAAADEAELAAIDLAAGWPGAA